MATATKKKANKKPASKQTKSLSRAKKASAKGPTRAPAKAGAAKAAAATKPTTKASVANKATSRVVAKKAKARNAEPDRSSPAMAEVDADVLEFIAAIDEFKQANGRPFPSWSEVLLVVRQLGYRRA